MRKSPFSGQGNGYWDDMVDMRQSIRNFNNPPGHLTITFDRGEGHLRIAWVGWGICTGNVKFNLSGRSGSTISAIFLVVRWRSVKVKKKKTTFLDEWLVRQRLKKLHHYMMHFWRYDVNDVSKRGRVLNFCSSISDQHHVKSGKFGI